MAACESLTFSVSSVNEVARNPYSTRDCLILLIFQSKTAWGGLLVRQARQTSLAGAEVRSVACLRLVQERDIFFSHPKR